MTTKRRVPVWDTGIPALNTLLDGGLPRRSVVLIAGEPGTGKTTLAWQIIEHAARKIPCAFMSFDESPAESMERYAVSFAKKGFRSRTKLIEGSSPWMPGSPTIRVLNKPRSWLYQLKTPEGKKAALSFEKLFDQISNAGIWVVNGVNALLDEAVAVSDSEPSEYLRHVQTRFVETFLSQDRNVTYEPNIVILTAEAAADRPAYLYESYMADVLIRTRFSEIQPDPTLPHANETILECDIPKARGVHVQRRRCCYEFVPGLGIKFYETYPAEGTLSLFCENTPQSNVALAFRDLDVPAQYPRLSVRTFQRAQLQHEYAIRRRKDSIPARHPMAMSHFDEYWVKSLRDHLEPLPIDDLRPYDCESGTFIQELAAKMTGWLTCENEGKRCLRAIPHLGNIGMMTYRIDGAPTPSRKIGSMPLFTWEQIEVACQSGKKCLQLEMKTVDSFVATFLELCWSHGGGWWTELSEDGLVVKYAPGHSSSGIEDSIRRLHGWIHDLRIVSAYSTVDPRHPRYNPDWLFARHWYSTLVDMFALSVPTPGPQAIRVREVGVAPIPVPSSRLKLIDGGEPCHSAWGEWYLAVWKGTENTALAIELANTFISSARTIQMAMSGAGIPLIEQFYREFGKVKCFGTDATFGDIRACLFKGAFSRGEFAHYRFVLQRVYAVLMEIVSSTTINATALWNRVVRQIERAK